jgi:hypothetical protein
MGRVFPICQKAFAGLSINLEHHIMLCYGYEGCFSRIKFFDFIFTSRHSIFKTKESEVKFFKIYQMKALEQLMLPILSHLTDNHLRSHFNAYILASK